MPSLNLQGLFGRVTLNIYYTEYIPNIICNIKQNRNTQTKDNTVEYGGYRFN